MVLQTVLHQLDQKIIYPHYDFKHLTEKYFEIGMKLNDFSIQLVKYCTGLTPETYRLTAFLTKNSINSLTVLLVLLENALRVRAKIIFHFFVNLEEKNIFLQYILRFIFL